MTADADLAICPACGERNPARARFCMECGARMSVDGGERRVVSVIFADLSGFTSWSERTDPEDVRALAEETAARLGEIVQRYGGIVDKVIGDCVMAVFGAPTAHEDDPERAVRCALEMSAYVEDNPERFAGLKLSIGVNTGEAMYAPVGKQGQYTVLGDTVNTAARLQSAAARGEVLIGEATSRGAASAVELDEVPPIAAKGKEEPVPAWRAVAAKDERRRARPRPRTPLVGRQVELERLRELWERARTERTPYFAAVVGAPGIGKSRLIRAFLAEARGTASVLRGHCLSYGEGITYWPVIEVIEQAAEILHDDPPAAVSNKLGMLLEGLGVEDLDQLRTIAVAVANLVAAPTTPRGTYSATEISRGELHWGIRRLLQLLARKRPLVLVVEDLHWAEPTLLDLLTYLLEAPEDAPLLVVGSARPELIDDAPHLLDPRQNRRTIALDAITDDDARALLAALLGREPPDGQLDEVVRAAAGNPLYLEELVRMLVESGAIDEDGRGVAIEAIAVPSTLQGLIDARLDLLPDVERKVATTASVVGGVFWAGTLAHVLGGDDGLDDALDALVGREVLHPVAEPSISGEREYAFRHGMIRDAAYARVPKAQRAELHERCGGWIAAMPGGEDEFVEFVAYHLEQACRLADEVGRVATSPPILAAARALQRAGAKAESRQGTREADRFYARALELVGARLPETVTELKVRRSATLTGLGQMDDAIVLLEEAAEIGPAVGRPDLRAKALVELANKDQVHGRFAVARGRLEEAVGIATEVGDARRMVEIGFVSGSLRAAFEGQPEAAVEELRAAIARAEEIGDASLAVQGRIRLGTALYNLGRLADAEDQFVRCVGDAAALGSIRWQAVATRFLGTLRAYRGPREDAVRLSRQALEWFERIAADSYVQVQTLRRLAMLSLAEGDAPGAATRLREALVLARRLGGWPLVDVNRYLAEALAEAGQPADARKAAAAAREAVPAGHGYSEAAALLAEGIVAGSEGNERAAREAFESALGLLRGEDLPIDLAEAQVAYARALRRLGDIQGAAEHLDAARETFLRLDAPAMVAEIDAESVSLRAADVG